MNERTIIVVHYAEIALKGKNRPYFENKLKTNIKRALYRIKPVKIETLRGRLVVSLPPSAKLDEITQCLKTVFGISHFSFGIAVPKDIEAIKKAAWNQCKKKTFSSFKIETGRSQKDFPLKSIEVNQIVGAYVQKNSGARVDLTNPEITGFIEITEREAFLYTEKVPGLRGLPVGVSEKAVSLLSSGIDSPVASYLMLKRGVNLIYVHFHSQPFTSPSSQENTARLVQILNQYQFHSKVYFVPFIEIQKEIMAKTPSELRVLLYRRYMVRIASQIANLEKATALVTGENVGQVASQTLSNIRVVGEVTELPILRPLAGFDKEEIIQQAKRISTFDISTEPYEDCCSLFVPQNPETKASPKVLRDAEELLDIKDLLDKVVKDSQIEVFDLQRDSTDEWDAR